MSEMTIYDQKGKRLYLDKKEVEEFLVCARKQNTDYQTFAEILVYTGCRISEALNLTAENIKINENEITFNSLKKRKDSVYRDVPVPPSFMATLKVAHQLVKKQKSKKLSNALIWTWTRQHANTIIKSIMKEAGIVEGKHRTPKGLRHAYGVNAIKNDIPLNMLRKWMGHADMKTTAIYANAIGKEEAEIASKMWN